MVEVGVKYVDRVTAVSYVHSFSSKSPDRMHRRLRIFCEGQKLNISGNQIYISK